MAVALIYIYCFIYECYLLKIKLTVFLILQITHAHTTFYPGAGNAYPHFAIYCCACKQIIHINADYSWGRGGGHLYFRLDIILIKGLSKHTLTKHFPDMKIHPKYAFLHVFFLIFCLFFFQNL